MLLYSQVVSPTAPTAETVDAIAYVNKTSLESYETNDPVGFLKKIQEDQILGSHLKHLKSVDSEDGNTSIG